MPRKTDAEFLRGLLVLLAEAMVFNDKAVVKAKQGAVPLSMISELSGNKLYLQQAMERISIRMSNLTRESRRAI